jgi:hypothetical protein
MNKRAKLTLFDVVMFLFGVFIFVMVMYANLGAFTGIH